MSLFGDQRPPAPLADRMRPKSLDEVLGQSEALAMLNAFIERGDMPSVVFFGPPGCGKTTLSRLMASLLGWEGRSLNATSASVKDIRDLAAEAKELWRQWEKRTLLFIDELHRLNKGQQDVLLPILEAGTLVMAGSTTENPFFALNQALRSRVQLIRLQALAPEIVQQGLARAATLEDINLTDEASQWIAERVSGDVRLSLTTLESAALMARAQDSAVTVDIAAQCLNQTQLSGDRKGDNHYDLASAFQKSLRGSDPEAAIYYLARFIETGEDPRFIARRLLITAAEDVGNADPNALRVATDAFRAVEVLGLPEGRIPLAQATLYVARAPKSNEAIKALGAAVKLLHNRQLDPIPKHLRDAHYKGAKTMGHGEGYRYSHDHPDEAQTFLPEALIGTTFTTPPKPKKPGIDDALRQQILTHLADKDDWFEVQAEEIAAQLEAPQPAVRAALNALVQDGKLTFKRLFRLSDAKS